MLRVGYIPILADESAAWPRFFFMVRVSDVSSEISLACLLHGCPAIA
jgi:hypothetical protein